MQSLIFFVIALALLVVIHEYGHFWVARRCGVKVLRFSVGFGKPIWKKIGKDGVEYVLAPIPLGGYVKMLDEREMPVEENLTQFAFNRQSLAKRFAIVLAGPVANLLFAIVAYWFLLVVGIPGIKPVISEIVPQSIAADAGLTAGDTIKSIGGQDTPTWNSVFKALLLKAEQGGDIDIEVLTDNVSTPHRISVPKLDIEDAPTVLNKVGLIPLRPVLNPVLGKIVDGMPAQKAGLKTGDVLLSANGQRLSTWSEWVNVIQQHPNKTLEIRLLRQQQEMTFSVTPQAGDDGQGLIGAGVDTTKTTVPDELKSELRYGLILAFPQAVMNTWDFSVSTLTSLWGMIKGTVSTDNLGGPISIAKVAGSSAEQGWMSFVSFLAMISITLGILNLLPIPMLDGGHLSMFIIEAIRGKPLSETTQVQAQKIGMIILLAVMFIAFFNDLSRLFG